MEEFNPFFYFSEADSDVMGRDTRPSNQHGGEVIGDDECEEITDDEGEDEDDDADDEGFYYYSGYEDDIARFAGFHVTPLGEFVFPDGRIFFRRFQNFF
jgi:hypothetical protein